VPCFRCAVERCCSSVGASPTWQLSLQPEAVGAAEEVTLLSEAFDVKGSLSDSATVQAVTRVNAEQASKRQMREPTQPKDGEGRCRGKTGSEPIPVHGPAGVVATACAEGEQRNTGDL